METKTLLLTVWLALVFAALVIYLIIRRKPVVLKAKLSDAQQYRASLQKSLKDKEDEEKAIDNQSKELDDMLLAGIRNARRIQTAAFTQKHELSEFFPQAFIFTKTKDIVSGDFYKAYETEYYKIFALADCAGCGIPGGFLSMMGVSILNEQFASNYYEKHLDLAEILDNMRDEVIKALRSDDEDNKNVNDGFNITLVAFSKDDPMTAYFAAAAQNLFVCHNGEVTTYNGDKFPVGWYIKGNLPFHQQMIQLHHGDMVFITTDSLQSQFGGPDGSKFTTKRMINMFKEIAPREIPMQESIVHDTVYNWVDGYKQIDDLSLAAIRVE